MTAEEQFQLQIKITLNGKVRAPRVSYQKFIRLPYWQVVREYVLSQKGRICSTCKATDGLHVHHTTYQHHGIEHLHWKTDLIVLCGDCHLKVHQFQKESIHRPYSVKIVDYTPKPGTASVLTLRALKKEAKAKGLKLPQLMKQYMDKGYGWINNNEPRKKKGYIDILVKLK